MRISTIPPLCSVSGLKNNMVSSASSFDPVGVYQLLNGLIHAGFRPETVEEAMPPIEWRDAMPEEMRRAMILPVKAGEEERNEN